MGSFVLAFLTSFLCFIFFFFGCVCDPSAAFWRNDPVGETSEQEWAVVTQFFWKSDRIILYHSYYCHAEKKKKLQVIGNKVDEVFVFILELTYF